jgi:deazaflavin-dependent oxidoreductase (nitroreductase family)
MPRRAVRAAFATLNSFVRPLVQVGAGSPPPVGPGVVVLETTGRLTGMPRQVPLLAARCGDRLAVSTVRPDSQWVRNLEANPTARVWLDGHSRDVIVDLARGPLNVATLTLQPQV